LCVQYYNQWKAAKAAQGEAEGGAASTEGGGGFASSLFAKRFYEGGFEDKMTRREAALILGVRCVR
jgi:DnaJ family protein C protein 15/DnaJ family protein C protein 19